MRHAERIGVDDSAARRAPPERRRSARSREGGVGAFLLRRLRHPVARLRSHRKRCRAGEQREARERHLSLREPHRAAAPSASANDSRTRPSKSTGNNPVGSA